MLSLFVLSGGTAPPCAAGPPVEIVFDPNSTFQTIDGWAATNYAGQSTPGYAQFKDEVMRQTVEEVGINRVRLELRCGMENSQDYWQQYDDGTITYAEWRALRYSTVNDNADPNVTDPGGFHFGALDADVADRVLPLKTLVEARGETLHVSLCYVAFTYQNGPGFAYHHADPAEYAEFVLAAFQHLSDTYGFVPDSLELMLEPDQVPQWSGHLLGEALVAAQGRLSAAGFQPGFVGPSTTAMSNAVTFFDELAQVPGALDHLTQISYHRYSGVSTTALQAIADRAVTYGLQSAQLEHIGATYHELHEDLSVGRNSAWSQLVLASDQDDGSGYLWIDRSGAAPVVRMGTRTRFLRLYFLWVRRGAVRVGATTTDATLSPLAFVNSDQRPAVVMKADVANDFNVTGLPAGTYGIRYATASAESVDLPDVHVGSGEVLSGSIPDAGVVTVHAKVLDAAPPPDPPVIDSSSPAGASLSVATGSTQAFSVGAHDPHGRTLAYAWNVDGVPTGANSPAFTYSAAAVGPHTVAVTVRNGVAQTPVSWSVTVTPISPGVLILGPTILPDHLTGDPTLDLSGIATSDDGVTEVVWSNDRGGGGAASGTTSWSVSGIALLSGVNVLTAVVTDGAAKTATERLRVFRDTEDPVVTITVPAAGGTLHVTTSPILVLAGQASDDHGVVAVSWSNDRGGAGTANGTSSWSSGPLTLSPGRNEFTVRARDALGHEGASAVTVDYDAASPSVAVTNGGASGSIETSATTIDLGGTASDDLGLASITWTSSSGASGTASGTASWSSGPIALSPGQNVLTFTATDVAGRTSKALVSVVRDTEAPVVAISCPTSAADFVTSSPTVGLAGFASDASGVAGVEWTNDRGGSGDALGGSGWSVGPSAMGLRDVLASVGSPSVPAGAPVSLLDLAPGTGFTGATSQPPAVGTGPGSDAKVIARWDVVPFQSFTGRLPVGVVAFHIAGIDRVEFSVEGGPWTAVRSMARNPATGVWEYSAWVDAAALADGPVEVRAVVYPTAGVPRVLAGPIDGALAFQNGNHSMFLTANGHGTVPQQTVYCSPAGSDSTGDGSAGNPYRSPGHAIGRVSAQSGSADGLTVYLMSGDYSWGPPPYPYATTSSRWIRLTPAPGVLRSEVVFDASAGGGFRTRLVSADNVTFRGTVQMSSTAPPYLADSYLWVNDCVLEGPGPDIDSGFFSTTDWSGTYFTACDVSNNRNGIRSATFIRDCLVHDISSSPFGASPMVVNSRCADRYDSTQFHGDIFHWFQDSNSLENFIAYGVHAVDFDSQGIFAEVMRPGGGQGPFVTMDNVALVDVHISKDASSASGSWWNRSTNHLLLWHVSFPDQPFRWGQSVEGTLLENVSIVGSVFHAFSISDLPANADVRHVHYTNPTYYLGTFPGTDVTFGDPAQGGMNRTSGPVALSPGANRITVLARDALGHESSSVLTVHYDLTPPSLAVTSPSVTGAHSTGAPTVSVAGTAADDGQIASVTWTNDRGGSGTATGTTAWTTAPIALLAGTNVLTFTATDTAGRTAQAVLSVFQDAQIPVVSIAAPTTATQFLTGSAPVTLSGTATDDGGVSAVTWTNDRGGAGVATGTGAFTTGPVALLAGRNLVTVTAVDAFGRTGTALLAVDYDASPPAIAATNPPASFDTLAAAQVVTGTASDDVNVASVTWTNDRGGSGTAAGTTSWTTAPIPLLPGANLLTFTATDVFGRTSAASLTVMHDVASPTIVVTNPTTAASFDTPIATQVVTGTASDDVTVASVTWTNDRGGAGTATGTTAWTTAPIPLLLGANVLTFTATDTVGRTTTAVLTVMHDVASPTIVVTNPTTAASFDTPIATQIVSGTASDDVSVASVTWTNDRGGSGTATGTTAWTTAPIELLPGANVLTFTATDTVGRTTTATLTIVRDVSDPSLAILTPTAAADFTTTSASVPLAGFASDDSSVALVEWSNDRGGGGAAAGTVSWSVGAVGLQPGRNVITVVARDAVGRERSAALTVWRDVADPAIAVTNPTGTGSLSTVTTTLTVGGSASDDLAVASVAWSNSRGGSGAATGTASWSAGPIQLASGVNVLTFTATDTAGRTQTSVFTVTCDHIVPGVTIETPTLAPTFVTSRPALVVGGSATDDQGLASVAWSTDRGVSGAVSGSTAWTATVPLSSGANVVSVTATDLLGNAATSTLTIDFRPASLGLVSGYNLVSLPCVPDTPFNASTLLAAVNGAGGRALAILDLDPAAPSLLLSMGAGRDFPLVPGRSYFVLSQSVSATALVGDALSVSPVNVTLRRGLNYVALPVASAASRTAAEVAADVAADGGEVLAISRWRNGRAEPFVPGAGLTDFDVAPGEGIIVLCGADSVWRVSP